MLAACTAAALALSFASVQAQGWGGWWPWSQPEPRPMPREPVYRPPPDELPPGQPAPGQLPTPGQVPQGQVPPGQSQGYGQRSSICVQLERRLVQEIDRLKEENGALVLTDMYGATPANIARYASAAGVWRVMEPCVDAMIAAG